MERKPFLNKIWEFIYRRMAKEFTIETVKWEWAPQVQRPKDSYRDDELVRTKTKEEALEAIAFLLPKKKERLNYTITVLRDGEYLTYWRHSMPCYGGLVKYRDSHGDRYFMNPYFPRDIPVAFPEGEVVYIACQFQYSIDSPMPQFLLSEESPWIAAFGSKDNLIFKEGFFVLTSMDSDPTVFYSLMRSGFFNYNHKDSSYKNWDPKAWILATSYLSLDVRRLAGQKPIKISGGTWKEGYGYTRPYNESIFKTSIPTALKDFGSLSGGYHNANFDTKYFPEKMKNLFGLTLPKYGIQASEKDKYEKPLIEAWDYFKKQSESMSDVAGKLKN